MAPHDQVSDLLPIGCLVVVDDHAYHCCVIGKLDDGGVVPGRGVRGEQGVQEGAEHTPRRGPSVEDQSGESVVTGPYQLGVARQEVQDQLKREVFSARVLNNLVMSFESTMVLKAEL